MGTSRYATCAIVAALLTLSGCAISPEAEQRRKDMEADIDEILSYELDETEYGVSKNCLSDTQYRSLRPLGDRHLLFEGRKDKQWVNVLRGRCSGLEDDSVFIMRLSTAGRACDMDRFDLADMFEQDLPRGVGIRATCVLGEFIPVTKTQVEEIEARLEMR